VQTSLLGRLAAILLLRNLTAKNAKRREKQSTLLPNTAKIPKFEEI
jgi:hypothetical protein